jgi:hypothetical protein
MNEERLHHAFLEGRFAPVQPASPVQTLLWSELPQTPDGRFLIAHLQQELLAQQQKHELDSATASSNVLTGRLAADKGLELKSLAVVPREVSSAPAPPPSPPLPSRHQLLNLSRRHHLFGLPVHRPSLDPSQPQAPRVWPCPPSN